MKRIFPALCALLLLTACGPDLPPEHSERLQIVAAVFPAYDFARAAAALGNCLRQLRRMVFSFVEQCQYQHLHQGLLQIFLHGRGGPIRTHGHLFL